MKEKVKFVEYDLYCNKCEHYDSENKCDECLSNPVREDSHKPINFKQKTKKRGDKQCRQ